MIEVVDLTLLGDHARLLCYTAMILLFFDALIYFWQSETLAE